MITLEAYRVSTDCFSHGLFSTPPFIKCAYRGYYNDILLMNRFLSIYKFLQRFCVRLTITTYFFVFGILLLCGDVETNPGPFTITKSVQGSFHQGDPRLGANAGSQCVCNSLFSIVLSVIKNVAIWNSADLDYILYEGNKIVQKSRIH